MERTYMPTGYFGGEGVLTTSVVNESDAAVTGYFRAAVVESHIPYVWENQDSLHWLVRDMLPDQTGELISLEPGDTLVIDKDFVINPNGEWFECTDNALNFELVTFVQAEGSGVETEIYQAAWIPLATPTDADYVQSWLDNADGLLHPGQTADYLVTVLNAGDDPWANLTGTLSSEDNQITIPDDACAWGAAEPGEEVTNTDDVFQIRLRTDGDDGHRPMLLLTIEDDYGMQEEIEHQLPEPLAVAEDAVGFELSLPTLLTSSTFATLTLPRAGNVEMSLVDASGRVVAEIYSGKGTAGLNLVRISSEGLTAGTYFLKVTANETTRVQKMLVLN
jgi:hypothetical protein